MKTLLPLIALVLSLNAAAEDQWREVPAEAPYHYDFIVKTEGSQAAEFVSTEKVIESWKRLVANNETVKNAIKEVYTANECDVDGTYSDPELDEVYCGDLADFSSFNTVLFAFGRGGWAGAGAGYRTFLTFTSAGTGHFTSIAMDVDSSIDVNAEGEMQDDGTVEFRVSVGFQKIRIYNADGEVARVIDLK